MRASADQSGQDARTVMQVSLGMSIRRLRSVAGLQTRKELAERLGVSQSQISARGLFKLATVFHCSIDERLPAEQEGEHG